jgi:Flp pilus assembly pilin Flp
MMMSLNMIFVMCRSLATQLRREDGQTLAEYGILAAVIAVIVIVAAILFGTNMSTLFASNAQHV